MFQAASACLSEVTSFETDCSQKDHSLQGGDSVPDNDSIPDSDPFPDNDPVPDNDSVPDNDCLTDHLRDDGYVADDEYESYMASHSSPSLDVRRPAETLPLHQPKPKIGVSLLLLDRTTFFKVPIILLGDGNRDSNKNCRDYHQFKSTLKICVKKENEGAASLKVNKRKEEALYKNNLSTSFKVYIAWQKHIMNDHVGGI
jgi:hypothetical protein